MHFTIVSYTFPPSKEIGGRRWAKFSQQLAKKGHNVTVVCANNSGSLEWYQKEFVGIDFCVLPRNYPEWLNGYANNILEKFLYLIYTRIFTHFTKKNLFDKGFAWRNPMLNALEDLHSKKAIDVLVVSGGPFSLLNYGAEFKMLHKEIQYVADIRDPWTWGGLYGIPNMSNNKKKYQELSELNTIKECNMFCYPTQNMGDVLMQKYPTFASKLYLLSHAFDPDKFSNVIKDEKRDGFIYGGTMYNGIQEYILQLDKIIKANPNIGFKWNIYTGTQYPLINSNFANGMITIYTFVKEEQLFKLISKSAAYLAFFPITDKDLISTKFFEIIYTETPILFIGEEGEVGKFIRENKLGVHILPENIVSELPKYLNGNVPFTKNYFNVSQYSFSAVTDTFLNALKDYKE